jgi:eukaryotic-like serine/threonine-protein kinase
MPAIDKTRWQKISPLLDELLDADERQRAVRLEQLRRTDHALADEVAALLARETDFETEQFLAGSALDLRDTITLVGHVVGGYTLERALGAGGMGSVWLARRTDGRFEGRAAVKFLNLALLTRGGAQRFQREGNILARLTHPNIARLLDAGVTGGQPFLILEYVDGDPIDQWCDARRLGIAARVHKILEVLSAVEHAHQHLVLHLDLKPPNILVRQDGQVKLLDFGISKLVQQGGGQETELTRLGGRALTPDYAAPEQLQGAEVTTASDVYALGVLLYRLLVGAHPTSVAAQTTHRRLPTLRDAEPASLSEAARAMSVETAAARSSTAPKLAHDLRGDLQNILAKALKKEPSARYATVAALADDLRRYLNREPVSARADSVMYRLARFVQRNRVGVAAAGAVVVVLLAGITATAWQARVAGRERDEALFQAELAGAKGNLVGLILDAIGQAGRPLTQREILDRSVQLIDTQFRNNPRIAIGLLLPIAGEYFTLGDAEMDYTVMRRAGEIASASGDPELIADVACNTVNTEVRRRHADQATLQLRTGLQSLQRVARPHLATIVECLRAEADIAHANGDPERAIGRLEVARTRLEHEGQVGNNLYPMVLSYLIVLHTERGDLAASFAMIKREQRNAEQLGQTDSVEYLGARREEAVTLMKWGEYREARAILEDVESRWHSANGQSTAPPWLDTSVGVLQLRFGNLEQAQIRLHEASRHAQTQGFIGAVAAADFGLAQVMVQAGRYAEAERLLAAVEATVPVASGAYTRLTPPTVRATALLAQGYVAQAAQVIDRELDRLGPLAMKNAVALGAARRVAARIYAAAGEPGRALQAADSAVAAARQVARDPSRSADLGEALLLLAQAQRRNGEADVAAKTARQAADCLTRGLGETHALTREARALSAA